MTDPELIPLPPNVAESLSLILQVANGDGARHSSSWERIQADVGLQKLDRYERLALAAALMEHGQALVNQAGSDLFEAWKPNQKARPSKKSQEAFRVAHAAADRACEESVCCFEAAAKVVERRYYEEDDGLDREVSHRASEVVDRLKYTPNALMWDLLQSRPFRLDVETVVAGFMALKVLGPFAEAFSKKLGELLAERTDQVIDRIHVTRRNRKPQVMKIKMPGGTAIFILPEDFSDVAQQALFRDLDLTTLPGTTRHWNPETSCWDVQPGA